MGGLGDTTGMMGRGGMGGWMGGAGVGHAAKTFMGATMVQLPPPVLVFHGSPGEGAIHTGSIAFRHLPPQAGTSFHLCAVLKEGCLKPMLGVWVP